MKILSSLALALVLFGSSVAYANHPVQPGEPGQSRVFTAFCKDEASAKGLSDRVATAGDEGYREFMLEKDNECYDARIFKSVSPVRAVLAEKLWTLNHVDGNVYDFWAALDKNGRIAYVWIFVPSAEVTPGEPI